jgi:hypothetical protein
MEQVTQTLFLIQSQKHLHMVLAIQKVLVKVKLMEQMKVIAGVGA